MELEDKAKVVAYVWGTKCVQFLAALDILPRTIINKRMNSSFSFKSSWYISSYSSNRPTAKQLYRGKELDKFCPANSSDDLCLLFCIYPASIGGGKGLELQQELYCTVLTKQIKF